MFTILHNSVLTCCLLVFLFTLFNILLADNTSLLNYDGDVSFTVRSKSVFSFLVRILLTKKTSRREPARNRGKQASAFISKVVLDSGEGIVLFFPDDNYNILSHKITAISYFQTCSSGTTTITVKFLRRQSNNV